jgi:hypothetical protein
MKTHKLEVLYSGIYIILFIVLYNLSIDNPHLELFRRYYWIYIAGLSFIYPVLRLKKVKFKDIILKYLLLLALTFLPEWAGDAVYYFISSSDTSTVLYFKIFSMLIVISLTVSYTAGSLIKIMFIIFIAPGISDRGRN